MVRQAGFLLFPALVWSAGPIPHLTGIRFRPFPYMRETARIMPSTHRILLLDDDVDLLDRYRKALETMPTRPEIVTCTSGAKALALLESTPVALMVSDFDMPGMDGLQVFSIVRRRFPKLRYVVMMFNLRQRIQTQLSRNRSRHQSWRSEGAVFLLSFASMEDFRKSKKLRRCFRQVARAVHMRS